MKKRINNKMKTNKKLGFTLIELLVVIAIIGLLSSVVLASLSSAREKAKVANIKQNLANMMSQVELARNTDGDYSGACGVVADGIAAIEAIGGHAECYVHNNSGHEYYDEDWAVTAHFESDKAQNYSVNSSGVVTWDTENLPSTTWTNAMGLNPGYTNNCYEDGKKLPTMEMLKSLDMSHRITYGLPSGTAPEGFAPYLHWSSTLYPAATGYSFNVALYSGFIGGRDQGLTRYVRCVR